MTLKEELEILRGEPIQVFDGDPMDIPCIETSDSEKLCKNPVVSVCMITYNHEPYIRQAIEGVMMQKTDFEFELIIGEDCSQDKTREICFEYQKKYPDKIRVLWWHENVSKLGGNGRRVRARCRGEFIAICEGDDYWIDPLKLQKQVDVMRKHPNVSFCFCGGKLLYEEDGGIERWQGGRYYNEGVNIGERFFKIYSYEKSLAGCSTPCDFILTASSMIRRSVFSECIFQFDVFKWLLKLGDAQLWLALALKGDVFYIADECSVYRKHGSGVTSSDGDCVYRDSLIVRLYFLIMWHNGFEGFPDGAIKRYIPFLLIDSLLEERQRSSDGINYAEYRAIANVVRELVKGYKFSYVAMSFPRRIKWWFLLLTKTGLLFKIHR